MSRGYFGSEGASVSCGRTRLREKRRGHRGRGGEGRKGEERTDGACLWRQRGGTCYVFLLEDGPGRRVDTGRRARLCWAVIGAERQPGYCDGGGAGGGKYGAGIVRVV